MIINAAGRRVDELTGRSLEGCAFGPCQNSIERGGASCDLCDRVAKIPQVGGRLKTSDPADVKPQQNAARGGAPKLAGERARGNLAFQKRRRVGPHR